MASEVIQASARVTWRSQAQGSAKTKVGTIIEVVPPDTRPSTEGPPWSQRMRFSDGNHRQYIVRGRTGKAEAGQRGHYWPVVSRLKRALES